MTTPPTPQRQNEGATPMTAAETAAQATLPMNYVHPITKEPLHSVGFWPIPNDVKLHISDSGSFRQAEGCCDFVCDPASTNERKYYDEEYSDHQDRWSGSEPLDSIDLAKLWREGLGGGDEHLLASLGDLRGKRVLLLGNGSSVHEYHFLALGVSQLVYTDLSIVAVSHARKRFRESALAWNNPNNVHFHAVNAYYLPYEAGSFDLVYGVGFIHHMDDPTALFTEIKRVLAPGGRCRFADTAVSPIWQTAKGTFLHPLQLLVHRAHGISPEDMRATKKGGFTHAEMYSICLISGYADTYFKRYGFLTYLLWRARCKFSQRWFMAFMPAAKRADAWLAAHTTFIDRQGISLICGFDVSGGAQ